MILLFSILVFLAVLLAGGGIVLLRSGAVRGALERRLRGVGVSNRKERRAGSTANKNPVLSSEVRHEEPC